MGHNCYFNIFMTKESMMSTVHNTNCLKLRDYNNDNTYDVYAYNDM